jgi:hypothetical protein
MKKIKIMLTTIAVFAVIGGALAFKAKSQHRFYTLSTNGFCVSPTSLNFTTIISGGQSIVVPYSTISIPNGTSGDPEYPCNSAIVWAIQ